MSLSIVRREQINHKLPADLHPVLARIYASRNIKSTLELEKSFAHLLPFQKLKNMSQAVKLLDEFISQQRRILIVGDFDADGATSCALAMRGLRLLGATHVDYLVPNRFKFGYGLTPEIVDVALTKQPNLIVTVDNGISSIEGVKAAKKHGIKILITDHHLPGDELPAADVIVNPNQLGDEFPSKNLAGVGVMFYVLLALRSHFRSNGWFTEKKITEPNLASLLDIVALGTVADVVPLDHNNRILVSQGLQRIQRKQCCAGISALVQVSGRQIDRLVASDLGFALGPRLNAAGRLEDMSLGIECLLQDDFASALKIAKRLDSLNKERRQIENTMREQAVHYLQKLQLDDKDNDLPMGLCLYDPQWHQGVIGILASRIKDQVHRPVIAFALADQDDVSEIIEIKGSARSVAGIHIRDVLDAVATRHPGLLVKFGGHAMAAGLTLKQQNFDLFKQAFDQQVRKVTNNELLGGVIQSDGELDAEDLDLSMAERLRQAGPWGSGFPEPIFDGLFEIVNRRVVGEKHLKLVIKPTGQEKIFDAIAFNTVDEDWPDRVEGAHIAYQLDVNEYLGKRNAQLIVRQIQLT